MGNGLKAELATRPHAAHPRPDTRRSTTASPRCCLARSPALRSAVRICARLNCTPLRAGNTGEKTL
eukprot:175129-Prorocentrum_minimum.AAC.1